MFPLRLLLHELMVGLVFLFSLLISFFLKLCLQLPSKHPSDSPEHSTHWCDAPQISYLFPGTQLNDIPAPGVWLFPPEAWAQERCWVCSQQEGLSPPFSLFSLPARHGGMELQNEKAQTLHCLEEKLPGEAPHQQNSYWNLLAAYYRPNTTQYILYYTIPYNTIQYPGHLET